MYKKQKTKSYHLTLDLVDRTPGILNVRHERGGNPTGIGEDGEDVVEYAHERHRRESDTVQDSGRRGETEPHVNENENGGEVNVSDCGGDNKNRERDFAGGRHIGGSGMFGGTGVETTASPATSLRKRRAKQANVGVGLYISLSLSLLISF